MYDCKTCGAEVRGLAAARRHAKQGHKTQREAFYAGQLHALELRPKAEPGTCTGCGEAVDPLATFPGGRCLTCHAARPENRRMPTADEVVAMWGGPARGRTS